MDKVAGMKVDMEVDLVVVKVANMKVDKVADMKVDMVVDMGVDKVADMEVYLVVGKVFNRVAHMVADMDFSIIFWAFLGFSRFFLYFSDIFCISR